MGYPVVDAHNDWCGEHKISPSDPPAARQSWDTTVYGLASKVDDNTRKDTSEYVKWPKHKQECIELHEPHLAKIKAEIKQTIDNMCNDGLGISSDITKITDYRQKIAELLGKL